MLAELKTEMADLRSGLARANGTGPDLLLDALDISITRNTDFTSTIEITIKTAGDDQQMPVIRFTSRMLLERILEANGITATTIGNQAIPGARLPAPGISVQIADLLKRMTACFALPVEARVVPVARQMARTKARAMSMNEMGLNPSVTPSYAYRILEDSFAPLLDRLYSSSPGSGLFLPLQELPSTSYTWPTVAKPPLSPLLPVSIRVQGTLLTPSSIPPYLDFEDDVDLTPAMRQATVGCGLNSGVLHCDSQGRYVENTWLDAVQLLSRDTRGREFSWTASTWRAAQ